MGLRQGYWRFLIKKKMHWKEEYVDLSSSGVQDSLEKKIAREQNHRYLDQTSIYIPSNPPCRK